MLRDFPVRPASDIDRAVYHALVPYDHYVRLAERAIDFAGLRDELVKYYSSDAGAPAVEPLLLLKLEFLQYHDRLSDRQVFARAQTDVAYRYFLGLGLDDALPDPSTLCYFRGRLGTDGHQRVFDSLVGQARAHGLVKDRLRIKDATHVLADVAVPTTLRLVAHIRDRLLQAAERFDPVRTAGERARSEMLRSEGGSDEQRLAARVAHLREILLWVDELPVPPEADADRFWRKLQAARHTAHQILADQEHPERGDRTRSAVDPDARRGKHGDFYDGYLLDVLMDADSGLITAVNVLPANGDEAADAAYLVRQEEAAHGNDVAALSIDGAGFQGPVLRELQDPQGLDLDVYVPPPAQPAAARFTPDDFQEDAERGTVTCPAGQESQYRGRDAKQHATIYRFAHATCAACPLAARCVEKLPQPPFGRTVRKNDYEAEYRRARQKAQTEAYAAVRAEHPRVERKLGECTLRHGARRARCRGRPKVLRQALLTGLVVNVKRMIHLLCARTPQLAFPGLAQ